MAAVMGTKIRIVMGAFAGMEGELLIADTEQVTVRVMLFGRDQEIALPRTNVVLLGERIAEDLLEAAEDRRPGFFLDRLELLNPLRTTQWGSYLQHRAHAGTHAEAEATEDLDRILGAMPEAEPERSR
jgi:hypothetical protein